MAEQRRSEEVTAAAVADGPLVNYDEPVVPQVYAMDREDYWRWTHRPLKGGREAVRMFKSEFWERLSHTYPVAVPVIWWPVITVGLCLMFYWYSWWWVTLWFAVGFVAWFPAEHIIHRGIFHMKPWNPFTQRAHFMFHAVHHLTPKDKFRLVMPPFVTFNVALVGVPLTVFLFDMCRAGPFWCGFGLMYTFYDLIHYSIHHNSNRILAMLGGEKRWLGKWYNSIKVNHLAHHYAPNGHESNFGVTNVCSDVVMRTKSMKASEQRAAESTVGDEHSE